MWWCHSHAFGTLLFTTLFPKLYECMQVNQKKTFVPMRTSSNVVFQQKSSSCFLLLSPDVTPNRTDFRILWWISLYTQRCVLLETNSEIRSSDVFCSPCWLCVFSHQEFGLARFKTSITKTMKGFEFVLAKMQGNPFKVHFQKWPIVISSFSQINSNQLLKMRHWFLISTNCAYLAIRRVKYLLC